MPSFQLYTPPKTDKKKKKHTFLRWLGYLAIFFVLALVGIFIIIKTNTSIVARLTDDILRPYLGSDRVIYLEKVFFNTSDLIERATQNEKTVLAPIFDNAGPIENVEGSTLNTTSLAVNSSFDAIPGEGVWENQPLNLFPGKEVMAHTFIRPDKDRSFAIVTIVQIDKSVMDLGIVAGIKQPGGPVGKPGPGMVPKDIISSGNLVAAFDGGFQYKDGEYGMIVGDKTYLPLKNDLGTLVGYKDGSIKIVNYQGGSLGDNIAFVRQNCPILIENGDVSAADPRNKTLWGRLAAGTVDIFTWRSALGINKDGNIIFAVGNNLTPTTLAYAMKSAGAVNAIQLDINPIWVRFNLFEPTGAGKYSSTTLTKDLHDGSKEYLNGYEKDFFYVYKK